MVTTIVNWDKDLLLPLSTKLRIEKKDDGYQAFSGEGYVGDLLSGCYERNSVKNAINDWELDRVQAKEFEGTIVGYGEKTGVISRKTLIVELDWHTTQLLKREEKRKAKEMATKEKMQKCEQHYSSYFFHISYFLPIVSIILSLLGIFLRWWYGM